MNILNTINKFYSWLYDKDPMSLVLLTLLKIMLIIFKCCLIIAYSSWDGLNPIDFMQWLYAGLFTLIPLSALLIDRVKAFNKYGR